MFKCNIFNSLSVLSQQRSDNLNCAYNIHKRSGLYMYLIEVSDPSLTRQPDFGCRSLI